MNPELAILQVLSKERHLIAKNQLLQVAVFDFYRIGNLTHSFSVFNKYLDRVHKLAVDFDELVRSSHDTVRPYRRLSAYEVARLCAGGKSMKVLRIHRDYKLSREHGRC